MDVGTWLRSLGLERYEQTFRDGDVDAEVLPDLTAEDLINLGVTSIGHRRKLLAAIAALRNDTTPPLQPSSRAGAASAATLTPAAGSSEAERRQLTVMFCDLVGSTALASRLDPEDLREVIGAYHRCVADTVGGYDGFVAKYMGDGVLVYFGWPRAHENEAERAVRAGLAVIEAVAQQRTPQDKVLACRIGIATGQATNEVRKVAPLFAALLSIPAGTRYPSLVMTAQRQRELTIAALLDQLAGLAARQPVLMVLEDSQWLDPTSTELFERVIERVQTLPVLLLITFRPEFASPWTSYPHMTSLTLNRLGRRHSTEMIAAIAGGKPLPVAILDQIWAKTEGVPLAGRDSACCSAARAGRGWVRRAGRGDR